MEPQMMPLYNQQLSRDRFNPAPVPSNLVDEDTPTRGWFSGLLSSPNEDTRADFPANPLPTFQYDPMSTYQSPALGTSASEVYDKLRSGATYPDLSTSVPTNLQSSQSNAAVPSTVGTSAAEVYYNLRGGANLEPPRTLIGTYQMPASTNMERFQPIPVPSNFGAQQSPNEVAPPPNDWFGPSIMFSGLFSSTAEVPANPLPTFQNMGPQRTLANTYQVTPITNLEGFQSYQNAARPIPVPSENEETPTKGWFSDLFSSPNEDTTAEVPANPLPTFQNMEPQRTLANTYQVTPITNLEGFQSNAAYPPGTSAADVFEKLRSGATYPDLSTSVPTDLKSSQSNAAYPPGTSASEVFDRLRSGATYPDLSANTERFQPIPVPSNLDSPQSPNENTGGFFNAPAMFSGLFSSPDLDTTAEVPDSTLPTFQDMEPQVTLGTSAAEVYEKLRGGATYPTLSTSVPTNLQSSQSNAAYPPGTSAAEVFEKLRSGATYPTLSTSVPEDSMPFATSDNISPEEMEAEEMEPTEPFFSRDTLEKHFSPVTFEKPKAKWKTATDFVGEFPPPTPQTTPNTWANSMQPKYGNTSGAPRNVETEPKYYNSLNEDQDQPWPFWIGAGTPAARVEPTWQDSNWYVVAPVDYKGLENYKAQGTWTQAMEFHSLNAVDEAVRNLDACGNIAALPPPRHWKEHKSCPIA